jgi:hypothetical protein
MGGGSAPTYQRDPYLVQLEEKQRRDAEDRAREAKNLYETEEAAFAAGLRGRRSLLSGSERGYTMPGNGVGRTIPGTGGPMQGARLL